MKNVIFDLDGTLGCDHWRRHLIEQKGWEAYFEAGKFDKVLEASVQMFRLLKKEGYRMFIITNRPEVWRSDTEVWLKENMIEYDVLDMRQEGYQDGKSGKGKQGIGKVERAEQWGLLPENVFVSIDDMDESVAGWRAAGYTCWQVREEGYVF